MEATSTARRAHHERGLDLAMAMSSLPSVTTYKEAQARAAQESDAPARDEEEAHEKTPKLRLPKQSRPSGFRRRLTQTPENLRGGYIPLW